MDGDEVTGPAVVLPTPELVEAAVSRFDRDYALAETALSELKRMIPANVDRAHILLKVVALNRLYSTQVYAVEMMADHIWQMRDRLDTALAAGEPSVVDSIARVEVAAGKERNFFSFATKYCSWHNPECYPIYDSRVYDYLRKLQKQDGKLGFRNADTWDYAQFRAVVIKLRTEYGLLNYSFKQLDTFLWLAGETAA